MAKRPKRYLARLGLAFLCEQQENVRAAMPVVRRLEMHGVRREQPKRVGYTAALDGEVMSGLVIGRRSAGLEMEPAQVEDIVVTVVRVAPDRDRRPAGPALTGACSPRSGRSIFCRSR